MSDIERVVIHGKTYVIIRDPDGEEAILPLDQAARLTLVIREWCFGVGPGPKSDGD